MRKNIKGFTLVECLVAMAILAIACMTLGAIEAAVARTNNANHFMNSSLANQMSYIEKYIDAETVHITNADGGGSVPPVADSSISSNSGTTAYVKIENSSSSTVYSYPVDIYIMYSRDTHDTGSDEAGYSQVFTEDNHNLRYKYLLGH